MIKALIFDLDDTLYREKDFLESGYRAVARHMSVSFGCNYERLYSTMIETLNTQGRQNVMTVVKEEISIHSITMDALVSIYRSHIPEIQLCSGYSDLLHRLSQNYRLGIITDGMPEVQERKVRALGLDNLIDTIIYTWEYGEEKQKPHPHSFSIMLESLRTNAQCALYIGDNPLKDCNGAHRAGMKFAQIRSSTPYQDNIGEEKPEFVIDSLFQLPPILLELN